MLDPNLLAAEAVLVTVRCLAVVEFLDDTVGCLAATDIAAHS